MSSMAKDTASQGGYWSELLRAGLYKPNQGRVVRQLTFVGATILTLLSVYQIAHMDLWRWLFGMMGGDTLRDGSHWFMMILLGFVGVWVCFRTVNYPKFADFLIAVEAEMNKVSWPTKSELWKASLVVIFVIFAMAALLFLFDIVWTYVFEFLGIRYSAK